MDRDFTDEDYEMLMSLDRGGAASARPVSQEALDQLPRFTHHAPSKARHEEGRDRAMPHFPSALKLA